MQKHSFIFEQELQNLKMTMDVFLWRVIHDKKQEFTLLKADVDKIKMIIREKLGVEVAIQG